MLEINPSVSSEVFNARRQATTTRGYGNASIAILEEKVEIKTREASLLAESEFMVGANNGFTIIPRGGAVTPSRSIKIVSEAPEKGKLQSWQDFQRRNPAVVRTLPISDKALSGDKDAIEVITKKIAALQTGGIAYVTTLNGNPVSLPAFNTTK